VLVAAGMKSGAPGPAGTSAQGKGPRPQRHGSHDRGPRGPAAINRPANPASKRGDARRWPRGRASDRTGEQRARRADARQHAGGQVLWQRARPAAWLCTWPGRFPAGGARTPREGAGADRAGRSRARPAARAGPWQAVARRSRTPSQPVVAVRDDDAYRSRCGARRFARYQRPAAQWSGCRQRSPRARGAARQEARTRQSPAGSATPDTAEQRSAATGNAGRRHRQSVIAAAGWVARPPRSQSMNRSGSKGVPGTTA
jgi:hypothetical protein